MDDIFDAVREALAAYLLTTLKTQFPTLVVRQDWPASSQRLAEYTITVLGTPEAADWEEFPPVVRSVTPVGSGVSGTTTYAYGRINELPIDLDLWASTKGGRNALVSAVRRALNRPPKDTLPGVVDTFIHAAREPGLVIQVPDLYSQPASFIFAPMQTTPESSANTLAGEWRSHFRGYATVDIVDQDVLPIIKNIILRLTVNSGTPQDTSIT